MEKTEVERLERVEAELRARYLAACDRADAAMYAQEDPAECRRLFARALVMGRRLAEVSHAIEARQ